MSDNLHVENVQLVEEFRKTNDEIKAGFEKSGKTFGELKEAQEKLLNRIDELEAKNQEVTLAKVKEEKEIQELKETIEQFEKKSLRVGNGFEQAIEEKTDMTSMSRKLFPSNVYSAAGIPQFSEKSFDKEMNQKFLETMAAGDKHEYGEKLASYNKYSRSIEAKTFLRTDMMAEGGSLCPPEFYNEIIKKITEVSPIRSIAKIRPTIGYALEVPARTTLIDANWAGEAEVAIESNSQYGKEKITANRLSVQALITQQELMNSPFDMQAEIMSDVAEKFAQKEGQAFVLGTGVEQPTGFLNDANSQILNSGLVNSFDFDAIIALAGEIKEGYRPTFVFNRRTRALMMGMKDSAGRYLWTAGNVAAGVPNLVWGYPYISAIDMPDVSANTIPVAFGDFARGYMICDRMLMSVVRDDLTRAGSAMVRYVFHRYVGGKTILPEAIKLLKCSM